MRVLVLSLDRELGNSKTGDTQRRLTGYAQTIGPIRVLVSGDEHKKILVLPRLEIDVIAGNRLVRFIKFLWVGGRICRQERIDLIVTNDPPLGAMGLVLKTIFRRPKLNVNVLGLEIASSHWLAEKWLWHKLLARLELWVLARSDSIRSDSKMAIDQLADRGIPRKKMFFVPVIPSRIGQRQFLVNDRRPDSSGNKILAVGNLIPQKGLDILLLALASVVKVRPDVKLTIVGSGPEQSKLEAIVRKYNLRKIVRFIGQVRYERLGSLYRRADMLVVSSWYEGGPRVVMEAALCGLPVISTRVGSVADMLTEGESILTVAPGDFNDLAKKISQVIKDRKLRERLGEQAKKDISRYCNFHQNQRELLAVWKQTVNL